MRYLLRVTSAVGILASGLILLNFKVFRYYSFWILLACLFLFLLSFWQQRDDEELRPHEEVWRNDEIEKQSLRITYKCYNDMLHKDKEQFEEQEDDASNDASNDAINSDIQTRGRSKKSNQRFRSPSAERIRYCYVLDEPWHDGIDSNDQGRKFVKRIELLVRFILQVGNVRRGDRVTVLVNSPGGEISTCGLIHAQLLRLRHGASHDGMYRHHWGQWRLHDSHCMRADSGRALCHHWKYWRTHVDRFQCRIDSSKGGHQGNRIVFGQAQEGISAVSPIDEEVKRAEQQALDDTHDEFKQCVAKNVKGLNKKQLEKVATGEAWFGSRAKELHLVHSVQTSQEHLAHMTQQGYRVILLGVKKHKVKSPKGLLSSLLSSKQNDDDDSDDEEEETDILGSLMSTISSTFFVDIECGIKPVRAAPRPKSMRSHLHPGCAVSS